MQRPKGENPGKEEINITPEVVQQISENRQLLRVLNTQKKIEAKMKGHSKK
jgi:hypothetical protein